MKNFIRVFSLITMVAFIGCATSGGGPASGVSGSKLNDADFKRMGVSETYEKRN